MGTGKEFPVRVGLAGKLVETTRISTNREQLEANIRAASALAAGLNAKRIQPESVSRGTLYQSVPVEMVRDFLRVYRADPADPLTDPRLMGDYIEARADSELSRWDVLFASAKKDEAILTDLGGHKMSAYTRKVGTDELRGGILAISGTSRRVGSPGDEQVGLTEDQIQAATKAFQDECMREGKRVPATLPPRIFCEVPGRRPLLILRFVAPHVSEPGLKEKAPPVVLAWSICFPPSSVQGGTVEYIVNTVRMREMFGEEEFDEDAASDE
jgi:hypothetical protein